MKHEWIKVFLFAFCTVCWRVWTYSTESCRKTQETKMHMWKSCRLQLSCRCTGAKISDSQIFLETLRSVMSELEKWVQMSGKQKWGEVNWAEPVSVVTGSWWGVSAELPLNDRSCTDVWTRLRLHTFSTTIKTTTTIKKKEAKTEVWFELQMKRCRVQSQTWNRFI